jgi:ribonuclease M5
MKPKAYIVEGRHDTARLKRFDQTLVVFDLNGSAMDGLDTEFLHRLSKTHDIVIMTDPDSAGQRIRRRLSNIITGALHAHIEPEEARSADGKKIGIEHATDETISRAISAVRTIPEDTVSDVTFSDLYEFGLSGRPESKALREKLARTFNLGHVNGKTLLSRIRMFGITRTEISEVLSKWTTT